MEVDEGDLNRDLKIPLFNFDLSNLLSSLTLILDIEK